MIIKEFVGRRSELTKIRDWLQRPSGGLVLITGVGGIGKTSILQKLKEEYSGSDRFVVDFFDLAEQPIAIINQVVHLARALGVDNLPEFAQKINILDTRSGESVQAYPSQVDEAVDTVIKEATDFLQIHDKRLLLLTDTFEIALKYNLYEDRRISKSYEKLMKIPGTCFVIAGRDKLNDASVAEEIYPMMEKLFRPENILHLPLSGFNKNEAKDFFAELDIHHMIPHEMREKLYLLTEGRPILLSLAVEWLQKNIPLPVMIEKSLPELRQITEPIETRKELLTNFEFELVSRVRQLQTPLDIAILYMAQLDRRMDTELLSILLDMNITEAEQAMTELLKLSFVKEFVGSLPSRCTLHDEMSVLVNKYAWQYLDISGEERKHLTRKVIQQYYEPRIRTVKQQKQDFLRLDQQITLLQDVQDRKSDWERWLLEAEALYYWLKVSKEDGYNFFDELYYDKEKSDIRDQFLIDELKRAGAYDEDKIALRNADDLRRRGQSEEAKRMCSAILEKNELSIADRIHGYTVMGLIDSESHHFDAEENFQTALELAESTNELRVQAILHNNLGRLYRNTSRLELSIHHFKQALELAKRSGNLEMVSTARNNLAWTYRLQGSLVEADALCRLAITENRKRGQERPLAYAYLTKADIDRDRGDLQNSERHAKHALDIFSRLEDIEGKAQTYRTLANVARYLQNFEQALRYLRTGILLAEKKRSLPVLASLYQRYGRAVRHYVTYLQAKSGNFPEGIHSPSQHQESDLFEDAVMALEQSISLAEQTHNPWEMARSQLEIALIMMLRPDSYNEDELNKLLDKVWQTASELNDELLMGYVYENRARIQMRNLRFLEAGRAFGKAARHIANRSGHETTRAFDRLQNMLLDDPLTNEQRDALARGVLDQISQGDWTGNPALVAVANMCEEILASPI
jgi:tetratricopeptide (TPR) repeat protein